jgi:excisionase family DNA binding protein
MSDLKADLLTSCAYGAEPAGTGTDEVTAPCQGVVAVEPDVAAPLPPSAPGRAPNSPRAPPWGVMQPAVQRLTPIGLSPIEAAQFLGTSRSRIYRLLREGRLVALKQGVATIITMESLTAYVGSLPAATFRRPAIAA